MTKLTKIQIEALSAAAHGDLAQNFDVYAGYWFSTAEKTIPAKTMDALVSRGFTEAGTNKRVYSGRQRAAYSLTDAGRRALAEQEVQHESSQ